MAIPAFPLHSDSSARSSGGRAVVLAGAGAAGNAWELGLLAGLAASGVDLSTADLIVGTSAGSTVAAQLTGGVPLATLYSSILEERPPAAPPGMGTGRRARPGPSYLDWSNEVIASSASVAEFRRRMGAAALEITESDAEGSARWRAVVAARLSSNEWPQQSVLIPAVDARTGQPVVFDRHSGVGLIDAVAASTSNGAAGAYRIGDRFFINGGYRCSENADLAAGFARVVVLSPFSGRSRMQAGWAMDLASQVAELRAGGSRVETVFPESTAGDVFNANAMDPSTRPQAARAGYDQGRALVEQLSEFWG